MKVWAAYEECNTCQAAPGEPCRQVRRPGADIVHGQLRVMARSLTKPHKGRVRNPGRVRTAVAASSRAGGRTTPIRGAGFRLDDET